MNGEKINVIWVRKPEISNYEDQDTGVCIILRWMDGDIGWCGMGWIDLAQNRDWWKPIVNMLMYIQVP
jgi:hypothetical protein